MTGVVHAVCGAVRCSPNMATSLPWVHKFKMATTKMPKPRPRGLGTTEPCVSSRRLRPPPASTLWGLKLRPRPPAAILKVVPLEKYGQLNRPSHQHKISELKGSPDLPGNRSMFISDSQPAGRGTRRARFQRNSSVYLVFYWNN